MLPSTITLNVGTPAADIVFADNTQLSGTSTLYFAPSAQSDLEGRPSLRVSHETTKAGVVRSLAQFLFPQFNSDSGKYEGFVKIDLVLSRSKTTKVSESLKAVEAVQELPVAVRDALAKALI